MTVNARRQIIVGFCIIFGSMAIAGAAFYFLTGYITTTAAKIVSDKSQIVQQTEMLGNVAALKEEVGQSTPYKAAMDQLIPSSDDLINFDKWISNIAAGYQVQVTPAFQGTPGPAALDGESGTGILNAQGFTLTANGTTANLTNFLKYLETQSAGFLLQVSTFQLTTGQSNGTQLVVNGFIYYRQ